MRILTIALLIAAGITLSFSKKDPVIITGIITDANGARVAGASIKVQKTKRAVLSDTQGNFTIQADSLPAVLEVAMVGFETEKVTVKNKNTQWIIIRAAVDNLDEVVVIGYGSTKKKSMTGAVTMVKGDAYSSMQSSVPGISISPSQPQNSFRDKDDLNREGYDHITENRFQKVTDQPLSTFSIDVDAASYSNVRRIINEGALPPAGAVRIEEMINYFNYNYPQPTTEDPFAVYTETAVSPWNKKHQLVMIGLQGKKIEMDNLPPSNLVFLIDVSGSMMDYNKLPLVKQSLLMLVDKLREEDNVAIVVYAGAAGLVLPSTSGSQKQTIRKAIEKLEAGGSTAGSAGIQLAYNTARANFREGGNNRVILCTDGDFNVGASSDDALETLIEKERQSGVFLTVLGYGMGNYQDAKMQKLADKGNGNHAYIDQISEAKKVLISEFGGTLFTIAKDVKLQIEFNPAFVQGYRLIGYENRMLNKEDFNNDKKDAGDMGSGHTVTALYEIIPVGVKSDLLDSVDPLKYQQPDKKVQGSGNTGNELMTVKIRYKKPDADQSRLLVHTVSVEKHEFTSSSENFRFATAVAGYGMMLRNSEFKGNISYNRVLQMVNSSLGNDKGGYRREFKRMIENTMLLKDVEIDEDDDLSFNK